MAVKKRTILIHADESCLGNGRDGKNPGGGAALVETVHKGRVERRDLYLASPDTTNNRMALQGAIETLKELGRKGKALEIVYVSDSQYLVKGMNEWVKSWRARGWRRKGGEIENLSMWKELVALTEEMSLKWKWVRGHSGHAKNEYVDFLAVRAATDQLSSNGFVESGLCEWLARKQSTGQFSGHDPDADLTDLKGDNAN